MRRMNPPDQIHLTGLQLRCHIGVPDEERAEAQLLHADIVLHLRGRFEDMADELSRTIDYAAVATRLEQVAARAASSKRSPPSWRRWCWKNSPPRRWRSRCGSASCRRPTTWPCDWCVMQKKVFEFRFFPPIHRAGIPPPNNP